MQSDIELASSFNILHNTKTFVISPWQKLKQRKTQCKYIALLSTAKGCGGRLIVTPCLRTQVRKWETAHWKRISKNCFVSLSRFQSTLHPEVDWHSRIWRHPGCEERWRNQEADAAVLQSKGIQTSKAKPRGFETAATTEKVDGQSENTAAKALLFSEKWNPKSFLTWLNWARVWLALSNLFSAEQFFSQFAKKLLSTKQMDCLALSKAWRLA